jgi:hypothetical protein
VRRRWRLAVTPWPFAAFRLSIEFSVISRAVWY